MLDLSRDEKTTCPQELQRRRKHFLPRWLREVRWKLRGRTLAPMMPEDEAKDEDGVVQGMGGEAAR